MSGSRNSILWRQVWGLSAILAAVMFGFMAYNLYQAKILQELGFAKLALWLGIFQGILGALLEPLVGAMSDRIMQRFGSRLPIITTGVTLAGLIFVCLSLLIQGQIPLGFRWIIPVLMTFWVMSIIIFRGPVIAILRQAVPLVSLPKTNVVLTIVFGLVGASEPILGMLLKSVGVSITFILGAIALTLGATIFYLSTPKQVLFPITEQVTSKISPQLMGLIFFVGLGVGIEINLVLRILPTMVQQQFSGIISNWIVSSLLLISTIFAFPMAIITVKLGETRAILLGSIVIVLCLGIVPLNLGIILSFGLIFIVGVAFALVFESQIPLALKFLPSDCAGLSTGLYFGGIGAAGAIVSLIFQQSNPIVWNKGFLLSAIAFLLVLLSLIAIKKIGDR